MNKKAVVEKWFNEVFTKGDVNSLREITAPDFIGHVPNHAFEGQDAFIHEFMEWFREVFVDDEWVINDYLESEDQAAVRYTGHMTYKGGWFGIPSTDQRVTETGMMMINFENGLIKEFWCEMSDLHVLDQLSPLNEAFKEKARP
ncbi:ester cyclase [Pseudalkalibacillus berkeleyi]|uniref:Ester cyclase n=1 Tax=Pseudalkalibacillus berkeleyi TaxID=1069813 RepID=A0ABS9GV97_9BACL|nr:ester cyclase [Pseudalkalibacillus berkeleyi]MCF6136614.1 ester cyclase [Pseudalkalibacillus berkeleyi]